MLNASIVSYFTDRLQHLSGGLVLVVVALLVFGEAALFIGFVLPGETSVLVAGLVASQGRLNVVALCATVVAAAIVGDSVGYEVGRLFGERLFTWRALRGRRAALERALDGLRRRGVVYVFVGRFTAFFRAVMPGLAGMSRLRYRRFLAANAAGGLLWGVGYSLLGYYAGHALHSVERYSNWFAAAVLAAMVAFFVAYHFVRRSRERRRDATWAAAHPDDSAKRVE